MSLNFPTAFWKTDVDPSVIGASISWESALWWSHGDGTPTYNNFTLKQNTNFPFTVDTDEYYTYYEGRLPYSQYLQVASTCYFGWYLDGGTDSEGEQDLSDYHEAEPWSIGTNGTGLNLKYESDYITAVDSGVSSVIDYIEKKYNSFTQSGDATGTFTLTSSSDLEITVSGLAKDTSYQSVDDNRIWNQINGETEEERTKGPNSPFCNSMTLHLYNPSTETETLIGSGAAPRDNRLLSNAVLRDAEDLNEVELWYNMDVQQVKLHSGDNTGIINTAVIHQSKGEPRLQSTQWVEQNSRIDGYCTADGIGTFHGGALNSLSAGIDYQIRIKTSTYDNEFNSGAFYGFTFSFS
jgi:hypothetical protein|tara:strand:+ start:647 stop:1699 length:1053 start_codon:yes stop_codon:yes gene_type:complete